MTEETSDTQTIASAAGEAAGQAAADAVEQAETAELAEHAEMTAEHAEFEAEFAGETANAALAEAAVAAELSVEAQETADAAADALPVVVYATMDALDALNARISELETRPHLLNGPPESEQTGPVETEMQAEPEVIEVSGKKGGGHRNGTASDSRRKPKFGRR
jgi:hypothetical protein